jgi:hypothetical protein
MPLFFGDKLGPYEILAPIGASGMGEVWKALDSRLNRMVAVKHVSGWKPVAVSAHWWRRVKWVWNSRT